MNRCYLNIVNKNFFQAVICMAMILPVKALAQSTEYLLKAGYIEKFTHFIEWPPETTAVKDTSIAFSISVIGENNYSNAIENIFSKVKIGNKNVRIRHISSVDEISNSMILIIPESQKNKLDKILGYTTGKPILTVGETKGYGKKGVIINMFIENNYIRYEINRTALGKSGLKISAKLLEIARIIPDEG
jgi:hypothetical protein